jgi:hypothetical protein
VSAPFALIASVAIGPLLTLELAFSFRLDVELLDDRPPFLGSQ